MNDKSVLIFILILAIALVIACVVALILLHKNRDLVKKSQKTQQKNEILNLEALKSALENTRLNSQQLQEFAIMFINTQKFDKKKSKQLSQAMKEKLDFIALFAAHPNASAKNISFLNRELNKRYGIYKSEIDGYEQMGLAKRKMRESGS
ncbi:hypothetical protein [Campylobacter sp. US33a]|uniref:hypothetical protein n=1 Tax=Campylobacter sp. US33a TaxID=2498120 RepID=UPI00106803AC|nr:hypothetical protein [Campylobacter sp. US33a]TEY03571.1 hypothetical protein ELQ16_03210 [Campylobacter sp. US33a]